MSRMPHFEPTPSLEPATNDVDRESTAPEARAASFIRPHGDTFDSEASRQSSPTLPSPAPVPSSPSVSSSTLLAAAPHDAQGFLDAWLARHFSISVKLFDLQRVLGMPPASATRAVNVAAVGAEAELVISDLELVQDVLFEVREFADHDETVRAVMQESEILQNGVVAVYAWLDETLDAIARTGTAFRRSPSFVDARDGGPPHAMLRAFERLHPDLEALVVGADGVSAPETFATNVGKKLAICFRQIGAAIVRISGRGASTLRV
jgi:hypothetical protein